MRLIMCADPLNREAVDPAFAAEYAAVTAAGLEITLISYETLVDEGNAARAVRRLRRRPGDSVQAVYRGWMLRPAVYGTFRAEVGKQGFLLVNDLDAYRVCHELPASYPFIQAHTPRTIWLSGGRDIGIATIMRALRVFGDRPVIVKDYVKSQKHAWDEACYIPSAADEAAVARVVSRFLELQGDDLVGGLVFREYVSLQPLATHSQSGMPLTREFRLFFVNWRRMMAGAYWEEGDYGETLPPDDLFAEVAAEVPSRFFTMDVAQRTDGTWMIIELGDGQVAGLPPRADPVVFYCALAQEIR